jgi:hypothetical protein
LLERGFYDRDGAAGVMMSISLVASIEPIASGGEARQVKELEAVVVG